MKVGDKVRIIHLKGEDNRYDGKEGVIEYITLWDSYTEPGADWQSSPKKMSSYG